MEPEQWDGNQWIHLDTIVDNEYDVVGDLLVYNDLLYICGAFKSVGHDSSFNIVTWDGLNWGIPNGIISNNYQSEFFSKLSVYNKNLILTGRFDSLSGVEVNNIAEWDGVNIWPLFSGEKNPALSNREFYCQGVQSKSAALHQGNWKLVVHRHKSADKTELFDLSADPYEKNDLSATNPELVATMLKVSLPFAPTLT